MLSLSREVVRLKQFKLTDIAVYNLYDGYQSTGYERTVCSEPKPDLYDGVLLKEFCCCCYIIPLKTMCKVIIMLPLYRGSKNMWVWLMINVGLQPPLKLITKTQLMALIRILTEYYMTEWVNKSPVLA